MYCKLSEEQNLRKVSGWVYIFLATPVEVMMREMMQSCYSDNYEYIFNIKDLNLSNPDLQLANTKTMSKHNIRELSSELKNFYVQSKIILTISEEK